MLTRSEIRDRAEKVVADYFVTFRRPIKTPIADDARFVDDMDADSLSVIEITMALEDAFGVEIPDADAEGNKTFGATVTWLVSRLAPGDDTETCIACAIPFKEGEMVLDDMSGGSIHVACCGPERQGYVKDLDSGDPLGPDDPIPTGYTWSADTESQVAA